MKRLTTWLIRLLAGKRALILADKILIRGVADISGTYIVIRNVDTPAHPEPERRSYGPVPSPN